jgi:cation diffusion facilitator CzcD-associated flavoprotein CzcO
VAVIGTGASAIQFVPEIQPKVGRLHLFQRTPSWVMPDPDRPLTNFEHRLFERVPAAQRAVRGLVYVLMEGTVLMTMVDKRLAKGLESIARRHLRSQVRDPELRRKLTPHYTIGCKRITMSDSYYPALAQPNAEVVTDGIREIRGRSIVTVRRNRARGRHDRPGHGLPRARRSRVRPGARARRSDPGRGVEGLTTRVSGNDHRRLPQPLLLVGPNSAGGFNSIIFTSEAHINYALNAIKAMERHRLGAVEVRSDVYDAFAREAEEKLRHSVWNEGGCQSWYLDPNGRNGVWWPGFMGSLWRRTPPLRPQRVPRPARLNRRATRLQCTRFPRGMGRRGWQRSRQRLHV